jgi:hypothetical protein
VIKVFRGEQPACAALVPLVTEILGLDADDERWLRDTVLGGGEEQYRSMLAGAAS